MEMNMRSHDEDRADALPRRRLFGRLAAGLGTMSPSVLIGLPPPTGRAQAAESDGPDWPGKLKGRHRQVFDIYDINDGFPLGFANNFLPPNQPGTTGLIFRPHAPPHAPPH